MAKTATVTASAVYRASSNSATTWDATDLRTGYYSGNQWRGKIVLPQFDVTIGKSKKLVVAVTHAGDYIGRPGTVYGVLSEADLTPNLIMSSNKIGSFQNGPHETLVANTIADSYAYSDAEGTTRIAATTSMAKNGVFYFVFNTENLKAGKTYYIYALRNSTETNTNATGFTIVVASGVTATLTYEDGSYVYANVAGAAVKCEVYANVAGIAKRCEVYTNVAGSAVKC